MVAEGRAEVLVLSLGAGGALLVTGDTARRYPAPRCAGRQPGGRGRRDAGRGPVGLTEGQTLAAAVGYGVAAGSAALLHPGTTLCTREDADRLALDVGEGVLVA